MKLLFENWRQYLNENVGREIWYHLTTPDRAELIEKEGLKINQEACLTTDTGKWAKEYYGTCPIYLSLEPYIKREELPEWDLEDATLFEVDVADMTLVADLQMLIDKGAMVDQDSEKLWWEENQEPEMLKGFLDDGSIEISRLLNDPDVVDAAIQTTKTAAIVEDILPEQIKRSDY
jgi:hypothetical protein